MTCLSSFVEGSGVADCLSSSVPSFNTQIQPSLKEGKYFTLTETLTITNSSDL